MELILAYITRWLQDRVFPRDHRISQPSSLHAACDLQFIYGRLLRSISPLEGFLFYFPILWVKTLGRPILSAGRILLSEEEGASLLSFDTNCLCIGHSQTRDAGIYTGVSKSFLIVNGVSFYHYSLLPLGLVVLLTNPYSHHIHVTLFIFVLYFSLGVFYSPTKWRTGFQLISFAIWGISGSVSFFYDPFSWE